MESLDGGRFRRDAWTRAEGGGGISCLIEDGALFERGGVNFSRVQGTRLPASASAARMKSSVARTLLLAFWKKIEP